MERRHLRGLSKSEKQELKATIYNRLELEPPEQVLTASDWKKAIIISVAASIIVLFSGLFLFPKKYSLNQESQFVAATGNGETKQIRLPDGSSVILNAASSLKYSINKSTGSREVTLKGNGFFKVTKDPSHPKFIVHAHDIAVSVLGTQFNVNARSPQVEVALTSGRVHVGWNSNSQESAQMLPGDLLKTDNDNKTFTTSKMDTLMYSAWTRGEWNFRNTSLADMSKLIEEYYGSEIVFKNEQSRRLRMTGVLPVTGLHDLVKVISETLQVPIKENGNQLFIQ
jgi:transmembrane sensor